ncbi:MAG TPA: VOC family protein [Verrucomicrobiae bacterium]|nr:VOC family protein [Verrucomicrobiae bacterium]
MWGFAPFYILDNYVIDVRNLSAAREWYKEKLGLQEIHDRKEDDSGRPFADVCLFRSRESKSREKVGVCSLIELEPGTSPEKRHVIFYASHLEKVQKWLADRGVAIEAITNDSGGNRFFRFFDLDDNPIEVCVEP